MYRTFTESRIFEVKELLRDYGKLEVAKIQAYKTLIERFLLACPDEYSYSIFLYSPLPEAIDSARITQEFRWELSAREVENPINVSLLLHNATVKNIFQELFSRLFKLND